MAGDHLVRERGEDITLSEDEQLVFDAIVRGAGCPVVACCWSRNM